MKRLALTGRRVRVFGDATQERRDSFGRLLAYVKTRGGPQLNIVQPAAQYLDIETPTFRPGPLTTR